MAFTLGMKANDCLLSKPLSPSRKSVVLSQQGPTNKPVSRCHLLGHKLMCLTAQAPVLGCSVKILLFIVLLERRSSVLELVM